MVLSLIKSRLKGVEAKTMVLLIALHKIGVILNNGTKHALSKLIWLLWVAKVEKISGVIKAMDKNLYWKLICLNIGKTTNAAFLLNSALLS